jgi:histidyl-tRNA synthetase
MSDPQKQKVYKPKPISGFPEWLPEERLIEQKWFDHIRRVFESYGFCSIETPSVEELDVLTAKGEVDKEIYVIERLHKDKEDDSESRLALHFDQTVPLARYVAMRFNDLDFPFKRYQMQKVWRGERPQAGRFREFYQCDIDVINVDHLPLSFDAELPAIMIEILQGLDIGKFTLQISNRKILIGFLKGLGIEDPMPVLRAIDKMEKIGADATKSLLQKEHYSESQIDKILAFAAIKSFNLSFVDQIKNLGISDSLLAQGLEELEFVMRYLLQLMADPAQQVACVDLSIVRGLDYYTGTVYETRFNDDPSYGSLCSGGRYEDLAGNYIHKSLPGVGISIGFSRLFDYMRSKNLLPIKQKTPTDILVVLPSEEQRKIAAETAHILRRRGFNVELYHSDQKLKKQLGYAEKKQIPYVWFPPFDESTVHEIKNMMTGDQFKSDPTTWEKPQ